VGACVTVDVADGVDVDPVDGVVAGEGVGIFVGGGVGFAVGGGIGVGCKHAFGLHTTAQCKITAYFNAATSNNHDGIGHAK